MKVDIITESLGRIETKGGADLTLRLLSTCLKDKLERLRIYTTYKPRKDMSKLTNIPNTSILPHKLLMVGNPVVDEWIALNLRRIIEKDKPDIIHAWDHQILPSVLKVSRKLRVPIVASMHNNMPTPTVGLNPLVSKLLWLRDTTLAECFSKVNHIAAISDHIKRELVAMEIDERKITTIHYVLPPNWCESGNTAMHKNKTLLVYTGGRICRQKGHDILIRSIGMLIKRQDNLDVKLIISGDGPDKKKFEKLATNLGIRKYIHFPGRLPLSEVKNFYSLADIVVLPTITQEPFSRVPLEAMEFGKPVIATNVGGTPEIIKDGVNGILVPPGDAERLCEAIERLFRDEELRKRLGSKGKETLHRFTPEEIVNRFIDVYTRAMIEA